MLKIKFLFFSFSIVFGIIIIKLFFVQVISARVQTSDYLTTKKTYPERGKILDRNGEPLVVNQTKYLLYAEPTHIPDRKALAEKIDKVVQMGEATIEAKLDPTKQWVAIKRDVTKEQKEQLQKMIPKGIGFDTLYERYYPEASLSAHLLGFVGKNTNGDDVGAYGIEGFYNQELVGLPGLVKSERDILGRPIFIGTQEWLEPQPGSNLTLTIDKTVQRIVKEKLKWGIDRSSAKSGCAIAVDPMTMEVLALSCLPDFDPSLYGEFSEDLYSDTIISDTYEPGSTFKPMIMAAGLEEGVVKPDTIFDEKGGVHESGYVINNFDSQYEGPITMQRVIVKSSNVGMVYVGSKLGNDRLFSYIKKFGFGEPTGIDLQGEAQGSVKERKNWYPIDYDTATFGQGIGITRMQLVRAFAAVINGGLLMKPYIVKEVNNGETHHKREPQVVRRVISKKTSDEVKEMLVKVVYESRIGWDRPAGYKVGGKTGTAQIALTGKYDPSKTIASFIGFAPADKPKFLILVVLKEPGLSGFGSTTAAPIFFAITKELLSYYNIPPTNDSPPTPTPKTQP